MIALQPKRRSATPPDPESFLQRSLRRLRLATGLHITRDPGVRRTALERDYDLFFLMVQRLSDLACLPFVEGWRARSKVAICWIEELWIDRLKWRKMLDPLRDFDHVILYCSATVDPLSEIIDRPCTYAPPGIDALKFCPFPDPPARTIDVYCMGRRSPATHASLYRLAQQGAIHYLYDSAGVQDVMDPSEHRTLLASLIKRSRYFIANKAKVDQSDQTLGQEEFGMRFFEGAAGGAVLLGHPPDCDAYREHFDWPDAMVHLEFGSTRAPEIIAELDSQPDRVATIRRNNVVNCLRRHDWVYRWERVLELAGLETTRQADTRKTNLSELAGLVDEQTA
jgi:hypothetical protein